MGDSRLSSQRVLWAYIRQRLMCILLFFLFLSIYSFVFFLYNLPREPIGYASALVFVCAAFAAAIDFVRFHSRYKRLHSVLPGVEVSLSKLLEPEGLLEREYQKLLRRLFSLRAEVISNADSQRAELMDYYTLWVHQIKTPIAAMKLLLQQKGAFEKRGAMFQELFKIEQYADMALQYLRIDSMSSDLLLAEYDLDGIVKQAVKKYAATFIYKKIKLHYEESGLTVLTDEKWLVFVLEQLFSNALKYTPEGGDITVFTEAGGGKNGEGRKRALILSDTGIGIGAEDLPRIFERGFTGKNGRMDKKSTGIGLYLCREILERLSHRISVASAPGEGAVVRLDLSTDPLNLE